MRRKLFLVAAFAYISSRNQQRADQETAKQIADVRARAVFASLSSHGLILLSRCAGCSVGSFLLYGLSFLAARAIEGEQSRPCGAEGWDCADKAHRVAAVQTDVGLGHDPEVARKPGGTIP
jgi:hypothetical protein